MLIGGEMAEGRGARGVGESRGGGRDGGKGG
jgi:hypothetical protein